jgi:hypothetical protein
MITALLADFQGRGLFRDLYPKRIRSQIITELVREYDMKDIRYSTSGIGRTEENMEA